MQMLRVFFQLADIVLQCFYGSLQLALSMSDTIDKLEAAITAKDENALIDITINHTNAERVKMRDDYKAKFGRDLLEDFEKNFKSAAMSLGNF